MFLYEHSLFLHADVAERVLNECIKSENWETEYGSPRCQVEFEYDLLEGYVKNNYDSL